MRIKTFLLKGASMLLAMTFLVNMTACGKDQKLSPIGEKDFLKTAGKNLKNNYGAGEVVNLRGTNAGGYLLQEFWMTPTSNSYKVNDQHGIIDVLTERFGQEKAYELIDLYEENYWTEADFENCANMGMNCVRLPIWWRNLVDEEGNYYGYDEQAEDPYETAFKRIDWFVETAGKYGLYVVLDMHGAPGSQNGSDHSGVDGGSNKMLASKFWFGKEGKANKEVFYNNWEVIAARFQGNPIVAGYDLLNEPFCTYRYDTPFGDDKIHEELWNVYNEAYNRIRAIDEDHIIIMEAVWDPIDLPNPADYGWENVMYEYHNYLYDDYDNAAGGQISNMKKKLSAIDAAGYDVPSYMGEFSYFNNLDAWDEGLELLTNKGINWTTWTYKTVMSYGNWGLYHHPSKMEAGLNVETASLEEIEKVWSSVGTAEGQENSGLIELMKKWCSMGDR